MSKLTITLTLDNEDADLLLDVMQRGLATMEHAQLTKAKTAPVVEYIAKRVDDVRVNRLRKERRK